MKIMAVGSSAIDLELFCGATLKKFAQEGHQLNIIIVQRQNHYTDDLNARRSNVADDDIDNSNLVYDMTQDEQKALFGRYGNHELYSVSEFDFSAITQRNADLLNAFRNKIKPGLVIIPFWKSTDYADRVLSRSALIACRGIGSILMYSNGKDQHHYNPNVLFQIASKSSTRQAFHGYSNEEALGRDPIVRQNSLQHDDSGAFLPFNDNNIDQVLTESFESHRLLLLEDEENDWL